MAFKLQRISYGNDEAILRLRKRTEDIDISNPQLGKRIWEHIRSLDPEAEYLKEDMPCAWGDGMPNGLPKTSTQFLVNPSILPDLYRWLDSIE